MPFPFLLALPIIGDIIKGAFGIIDQLVVDKDKAAELKAAMQTQFMALDYKAFETEINRRADIIVAEAQGGSWLQRNWRPGLMVLFGLIVLDNQLFAPYLHLLFGITSPVKEIPADMWALLKLGVGGYVVGRSGEKIVALWKKGNGKEE